MRRSPSLTTLCCILALLTTSGCGRSVATSEAKSIRKIAVFSNLGNHFQQRNFGWLSGDDQFRDASAWKLDKFAAKIAKEELLAYGFEEVDVVSIDEKIATDGDYAMLISEAGKAGYDAIVTIYPSNKVFIDLNGNTNPIPEGYGFFSSKQLGFQSGCVYTQFLVSFDDARSQKNLATRHTTQGDFILDDSGGCADTGSGSFLTGALGAGKTPDTENVRAISDSEFAELETMIKQNVERHLRRMIPKMLPSKN